MFFTPVVSPSKKHPGTVFFSGGRYVLQIAWTSRASDEAQIQLFWESDGGMARSPVPSMYLGFFSFFWWFGFSVKPFGWIDWFGLGWFGLPFDLVTLFLWCLVWSLGV